MSRVRLAQIVRELPRHAHDLPRNEVASSQRWRILEATTEVTARLGYAEASVADVIKAAGVSRKTFYEHFRDKEACFLAAYGVVSKRLVASLVEVGAAHAPGPARWGAQLVAFLDALRSEPAIARVFMVDVLGAGRRALEHRERVNASFADALLGDAVLDPVRRAAVIGGVNSVVVRALVESRAPNLRELAGPLAAFVESAIRMVGSPPCEASPSRTHRRRK